MGAQQTFGLHQRVIINAGNLAGMVGSVEAVSDKGTVRVHVAGIVNGEAVDVKRWYKASQLGAFNG